MTVKYNPPEKFIYTARFQHCGCCVALCTDEANKDTAQYVAGWIERGLAVTREPWEKYVNEISKEETFLACPHGQMALELV